MNSVRKKTPSHQVYRKKTHTNGYLNVGSYHHLAQTYVILKTLIIHSLHISFHQFLVEEKSRLTKAFLSNGFSCSKINQDFHFSKTN